MKLKNYFYILFAILLSACGQVAVSIEETSTLPPQSDQQQTALPDLVVVSINVAMVDANGICVDGYQLFTSILNQGSAPADDVTAVEAATGHSFTLGRLEAGQRMDLQFPATATNGIYSINVDPGNTVAETNETNNNLSYLLPTPTPYAGCAPAPSSDATPVPAVTPAPVSMDGLIYADMSSAQILRVFPGGGSNTILQGTSARFSPDGLQAIFERSGDLWLAEPMDNPGANITRSPNILETSPQWWPSNPSKIVCNVAGINEAQEKGWAYPTPGYVAMRNTDGTDYVTLTELPSFTAPALSPDGKTIAYDLEGWPSIYEIGSGSRSFDPLAYGYLRTPLHGAFYTSPSFSPDGNWLTWWISEDDTLHRRTFALVKFDLVDMTSTMLHSYLAPEGTLGWLDTPVWSPGGQWIAFQTRGEETPQDLWFIHQAGGIGQRFGLATAPVWSPDGRHLAFVQSQPQSANLPSSLSIVEVPSSNSQQMNLPAGSIPLAWIAGTSP